MRPLTLAMIMTAALLAPGCAAGIGYSATVSNEGYGPDLVYAAPGVQVIADYDEPIFYSDNFYWRFYGGGWYRSPYYTRGWVVAAPPPAVLRIDRPHSFAHYRPTGWVAHHGRGVQQPVPRDHHDDRPRFEPRGGEPTPRPPTYQQPPPRVAPQAPRVAPQDSRNHDRRDDRDHGDHRDHRDHNDRRDHRH